MTTSPRPVPGYGFIGEGRGVREGADKSHTWIFDPLDGTTKFPATAFPQFAISIALQRETTLIGRRDLHPANDELYIASAARVAFLRPADSRSPAGATSTNA